MFNIFGKKKPKVEPPKTTKLDLDRSAAHLVDRTGEIKLKLEKIELELKTALENYRNARTQIEKVRCKKKAVEALKRKKMYQNQLAHLEQTTYNVENVMMQADVMKDNIDILRTLKQTNDLQRDLMKEMNVDRLDDLLDEMKESKYNQEEFSDAMTKNYEVELDESELDNGKTYLKSELEQLDYEMKVQLDTKELSVPNKNVINKKEKDENELNNFVVK